MINSDFDETYFRFQNTVVTNEQEFFVDREGRLVFTTPILTGQGNKITGNQNYVVDQNINPENVNFIIDNITLFSTNPDVGNYLPLKIRLDDNIEVEFPKVDYSTLTDYKIIVDPRVNLNTITNHKYDKKVEYSYTTPAGTVPQAVVQNNGFAYILRRDGSIQQFNLTTGAFTFTATGVYNRIEGSPFHAIAVSSTNRLADMSNAVLPFGTAYAQAPRIFLVRSFIYVFSGVNYDTLDLYVKTGTTYNLLTSITNFFGTSGTMITSNPYRDDFIGGYDSNGKFYIKSIGGTVLYERQLKVFPDVKYQFFGGSDISDPINYLISIDNNVVSIRYFTENSSVSIFEIPVVNGADILIKRYLNTAYFLDDNRIYFINLDKSSFTSVPVGGLGSSIRVWFDIDYSLVISTNTSANGLTVRSNVRESDEVYTVTYNYAERSFSYNLSNNTFSFIISLPNNNQIKDLEIFKYVFDIRIRYTKKAKSLLAPATKMSAREGEVDPNVPPVIGDMQQCEDECDITCPEGKCKDEAKQACPDGKCPPDEPSTRPDDFAGMTSAKDNPCKRKCVRGFGSAGRVLGYVDSDFSVVDFLNIYRTV